VKSTDLLADAFGRINEEVHRVVEGMSAAALTERLDPDANTIAWLLWHLARIEDDHLAGVAGTDQLWTAAGWAHRFALPLAPTDTGWSHTSEQVAAVRAAADDLTGYADAVHHQVIEFVGGLEDDDLDRIVDRRWDPPVTLGVRLVSMIADSLEHVGQAAYVRGVLDRR
jgi:uncharacterized damage-inducible protein DinB